MCNRNRIHPIVGKLSRRLLLPGLLALPFFTQTADAIEWGVAGHQRTGSWPAYRDTPAAQHLDLLKIVGGTYYRVDASNPAYVKEHADLVKNDPAYADLKIIPIIYGPFAEIELKTNPNGHTETHFYDRSRAYAINWINYWAQNGHPTLPFEAIEIDNERDLDCIKIDGNGNAPSGALPTHYDDARFGRVAAMMKGLCDGIRAAHPRVPRMVGTAGWKHYGFTDRLITQYGGPLWEINVWHWYSEMGLMSSHADVVNKLQSYVTNHNLPTWVTEVNCRDGSLPKNGETVDQAERRHADTLANLLHDMKTLPFIHRVCVYELLDEGYRSPGEDSYGMFRMALDGAGKWVVTTEKGHVTDAFRCAMKVDHNGIYKLSPAHAPGTRLHVNGSGTVSGLNVDIYTNANAANQRWKAGYQGATRFDFEPVSGPGMRLDVLGQGSANGTNVQQAAATGSTGQLWKALVTADGTYRFEPQCAPGRRLEAAGGGTANGTNVRIGNAAPGVYQNWKLLNYSTRQLETEALLLRKTSGDPHRIFPDSSFIQYQGTTLDSNAISDYVSYIVRDVAAGSYNVKLRVKKFSTRGIIQLTVGQAEDYAGTYGNVGAPQDLYSPTPVYTELDLGTWTLGPTGDKEFRFTATGKNISSSSYTIALDYIKLTPVSN